MKSKHSSNRKTLNPKHVHSLIDPAAATQTLPAVDDMERGNAATAQQSDHHSEPLGDLTTRKLASAEQAKLQRDPDALPATGYPSRRSAVSPAANPKDTNAIATAKGPKAK